MADITEAKVYEALGIEPEGANGQEVADPAVQTDPDPTEEGAKEQNTAESAQVGSEPEDPEDPGEAQDKPKQTEAQRKENAARRRQQEQQAAINKAVQDAVQAERARSDAAMKDLFARAGLKNTVTGKPITTLEEFNAFHQQFASEKVLQDLQSGKVTKETLNQALAVHPTVHKANEVIRQNAAAQKQQAEAAARERIKEEIGKIQQMDPSIDSVEKLLKSANAKAVYDYAKKGIPLSDAYYLANRQQLEQQKAEAAKQQALNNARGKDHMRATGSNRGGGAVSVPAEEMALFRQFLPHASEAEIQAYYNQYHKK